MHTPRPGRRRPRPSPSITNARQYLDHVLEAKGIELPDLPSTCVISYCEGLLERAMERGPRISFDIGVTVPTEIHLVEPEGDAPYGIVAGRPGSPMAAVLLEELIALGFERFVTFGTAGYPASGGGEVPFGQLVVPDRAYVYEGTSSHYELERDYVRTDWGLRARITSLLREEGIAYVEGPAATTDALYRETPEFISELLERGVRAVEMELSALLSVARFHDRPLAALLCISDVIDVGGDWRVGMTSRQIESIEARVFPLLAGLASG